MEPGFGDEEYSEDNDRNVDRTMKDGQESPRHEAFSNVLNMPPDNDGSILEQSKNADITNNKLIIGDDDD